MPSCPQALKEVIVLFKQVNTQAKNDMELYEQLPANRKTVLDHYRHKLGQ